MSFPFFWVGTSDCKRKSFAYSLPASCQVGNHQLLPPVHPARHFFWPVKPPNVQKVSDQTVGFSSPAATEKSKKNELFRRSSATFSFGSDLRTDDWAKLSVAVLIAQVLGAVWTSNEVLVRWEITVASAARRASLLYEMESSPATEKRS